MWDFHVNHFHELENIPAYGLEFKGRKSSQSFFRNESSLLDFPCFALQRQS